MTVGVSVAADGAKVSRRLFEAARGTLPKYHEIDSPEPVRVPEDVVEMADVFVDADRLGFSELGLLTRSGLQDLLRKRYPGATYRGQDPVNSKVPNYGALMLRDDVRQVQLQEIRALVSGAENGGTADKSLMDDLRRTQLRRMDWQTEGMDKSLNHWRR